MKNIHYLSAIAIITIIMGLVYASVQQTYRSNANDPQIQIAHDMKERLEQNELDEEDFKDVIPLDRGLAVFKIAYNEKGDPLRSTGYIGNRAPRLPAGVLDYVQAHGEDWFTWQPRKDILLATGVLRIHGGSVAYLAVGRSLKETEERISRLGYMAITGWIICIAFVLLHALFDFYFFKSSKVA